MKKVNKILIVGAFSDNPAKYTYASSFYKIFKNLGYQTDFFNYRKKFIHRFLDDYLINFLLIKKIAKLKPDLIFCIKAENIFSKTIRRIKKLSDVKIVNFYPDNPFVFWNGNSNREILNSLPYYDCFLIWSKMLVPILQTAGCKKIDYFPFAYDEELFDYKNIKENYIYDVCFVGTWEPEREKWLKELCLRLPNINLCIYGGMWKEGLAKNSILLRFVKGSAIYGKDLIKIFRSSKINLNFIRRQNETSHNMRTFEIPACGAFMLTQRTSEQVNFLFKENENIACFSDVNELIDKIQFYLKNENERIRISRNSEKRASDFRLSNQLQIFLSNIL